MPWIVDGDNLLGTWAGRSRSDGERRTLARDLDRWARDHGRALMIVFDGPTPPVAPPGNVRFSGHGRSADDLILEAIRRSKDPRGITVVTSDRSLGDQCRHLQARVERADRFRPKMRERAGAEKPEKEADIEHWLEIFEPGRPGAS